ncbi:hypothetical protein [Sorangium sp. So ce233]|uniref:hypothetical protein n=1 Tax=Sorangium sp. So ce233 TaxID=3133290 RepID=UPI003F60BF36
MEESREHPELALRLLATLFHVEVPPHASVAVVRARKRCDTIVLVVAPDAGVAAWAAENIDLGLGRGHVEPLVLGPAVVPEIIDPADAEKETELAVLSAVAHGNGPSGLTVVQAALAALGRLDQAHAMVYG